MVNGHTYVYIYKLLRKNHTSVGKRYTHFFHHMVGPDQITFFRETGLARESKHWKYGKNCNIYLQFAEILQLGYLLRKRFLTIS